jgi:hypothetical protein
MPGHHFPVNARIARPRSHTTACNLRLGRASLILQYLLLISDNPFLTEVLNRHVWCWRLWGSFYDFNSIPYIFSWMALLSAKQIVKFTQ